MADVLIKGMNMPENCTACPIHDYGQIDEWDMYCRLTNNLVGNYGDSPKKKRDKACPLVEVPTHGRLIDAGELRAVMYHNAFEKESDMQRWDSGCWIRYKMFEKVIESAPTVIEASEEEE